MREVEEARLKAVKEVLRLVWEGAVVGLGSGSTVKLIVAELSKLGMRFKVVPASSQTLLEAARHGLELAFPEAYPSPDIYLDSFDQVDNDGNLIKGGGGAHLREKVLSNASKFTVFVGDHRKRSRVLDKPVPLEVLPFALPYVLDRLRQMGGKPEPRI
ncbi:MAG: ribose-5-phosphate isomerase A, partial [Nitrososphaerota archaeon]